MYGFFFSIYRALFNGTWQTYNTALAMNYLRYTIEKILEWIMNVVGGNFSDFQEYTFETIFIWDGTNYTLSTPYALYSILALITMIGICFAVWKLTKMVFSIFFSRV